MNTDWKHRRLLEAADRFSTFSFFVDVIALGIFVTIVLATINRYFSIKILNLALFDLSWTTISILGFTFLCLLFTQLQEIRTYRPLSDFELEAALKAAKDKRIPLRRR